MDHDGNRGSNVETHTTQIGDIDENIFQQCVVNESIVMCDERMVCTEGPSDVIYTDDWYLWFFMDNTWQFHIWQSQMFF